MLQIQRTKRLYQDTRTQSNLDRLNEDLGEVTRVMTRNMEDLLSRGTSLEREQWLPSDRITPLMSACAGMSTMSSSLRDESLKYRKAAWKINRDALIRQYLPIGIIGLMFILVVWWRFR